MNFVFKETPKLFGILHITFLILGIITSILLYLYIKNKNESVLIKFIYILSMTMFVGEIWKQIFTYKYVFNNEYNMWFFPWQLCSMAMYCGIALPLIKKERKNILLVFLSTYSLLAAIVALIGPLDMLRPQVLLTFHGFIYHILMVYLAIISIVVLRKRNNIKFKPTFFLFLIMSLIAEIINIISHLIFNDIHYESNMFYISPFYPTTQPVFNTIADKCGIFIEVIIYLSVISLMSYLLYKLFISDSYLKD